MLLPFYPKKKVPKLTNPSLWLSFDDADWPSARQGRNCPFETGEAGLSWAWRSILVCEVIGWCVSSTREKGSRFVRGEAEPCEDPSWSRPYTDSGVKAGVGVIGCGMHALLDPVLHPIRRGLWIHVGGIFQPLKMLRLGDVPGALRVLYVYMASLGAPEARLGGSSARFCEGDRVLMVGELPCLLAYLEMASEKDRSRALEIITDQHSQLCRRVRKTTY
jgi:hypothetical protein